MDDDRINRSRRDSVSSTDSTETGDNITNTYSRQTSGDSTYSTVSTTTMPNSFETTTSDPFEAVSAFKTNGHRFSDPPKSSSDIQDVLQQAGLKIAPFLATYELNRDQMERIRKAEK